MNGPPTSDGLYCSMSKEPLIKLAFSRNSQHSRPTPESLGWKWDEHGIEWIPFWTTQPIAFIVCVELAKCSFKCETPGVAAKKSHLIIISKCSC